MISKTLSPLPWPPDALEPWISARTVRLHRDRQQAHLDRLLALLGDAADLPDLELEDLVRDGDGERYDQAAQVWNHRLYWEGLTPGGGGRPEGMLADILDNAFGSFDAFRRELTEAASGEFGAGWAWLVRDKYGRLAIQRSDDGKNPLEHGYVPLLAIDVWEHAYYLDVQHDRTRYVESVIDHLVDWDRVSARIGVPSDEEIAAWDAEDRDADDDEEDRAPAGTS